ncbi:MAG: DUF6525 family protein [Pelagimonas sp.]|jgi:hypothetical protein|nr:DUF6525 family protein [Pelagimonas sp.]
MADKTSKDKRPACNGGQHIPRRKRAGDPMRDFDRLPPELRAWMAQAVLPWSVTSCLKIWRNARASGEGVEVALQRLTQAEAGCLAKWQ